MDNLKKEAKGSPYYDDKFYTAKVDNYVTPSKLRYNVYSDQMEFMKDNATYEINKVEGLRILFSETGVVYVTANIHEDKNTKLAYLKELKKGRLTLYERQIIALRGGGGTDNGLIDNTGYTFTPKKSNYYVMYKNKIYQVPKTAVELKKILDDPKMSNNQIFDKKFNLNKMSDLNNFIDEINK